MATTPKDYARALQSLARFPLLDALYGRRSRRFGRGMEIPDGPLAYRSKEEPKALSEIERALLIAAGAGLSGWNLGIPHTPSGTADTGCNYTVRPIGRTFPSGAAAQGSELLITDDSGSYITRFRDLDPDAIREYQGADDLERLLAIVRDNTVKLSEARVELPREFPHVSAHNRWVANRPGTSLFIPVGDQVESLFNQLWIRSGEGVLVVDPRDKRVLGKPDRLIRAGVLYEDRKVPLPVIEGASRTSVAAELSIAAYNIHLLEQAIGLGGWLFSGLNVNALLGASAEQGIPGFGFRFARNPAWLQPNPVGLDGLFEPLVPPYVRDMQEAAERFATRKFGPNGNHEPWRPGPFRDNAGVKARIERYDTAFVDYLGSLAQDIWDTYGKFPATQPSVGIAVYTQAQHIDLEFYDTFYAEGAYLPTHAEHSEVWD
ncbi:hypothetical protein [Chelatococcus reniformis]|uniref:Uncharacterized protein n=1 Tax=Chelatococcus reniformis TaxID=1494448 RepID=A0A916XD91_9HYPH|nr:hypothetical protein [Chelatococcus reniformis]GGC65394.1 hypothetical protein GCM10010994_24980 [Chelatococcus reniformis]